MNETMIFDTRSQGYGLTLQQASKAIAALGILSLKDVVISNRHLVHTVEGIIIGEWGMRKWIKPDSKKTSKKLIFISQAIPTPSLT